MEIRLPFKDKTDVNDSEKVQYNSVKGRVRIYEHKIKNSDKKLYLLRDTTNLVVFRGRNWLAQRAFNTNMSSTTIDMKSLYPCWLAIGTGATIAGNPTAVSSPDLTNTELSAHGVIDSGIRYVTVDVKQYHLFDNGYPTIIEDTEVSAVGLTTLNDRKLIAKTITTFEANEANNDGGISDSSSYQEISEAGVFVSDSDDIYPVPTIMRLFARVTFPTVVKNNSVRLIIEWEFYF